jgi:NitT/TauT family transport system permease protein
VTAALDLPLTRTTSPSTPAPASVWTARIGQGAVAVGALAAGIGLWYAVTYLVLSPSRRFLLPAPHTVLTESLLNPAHLQPMLTALGVTAKVAGIGFLFATLIGVAVGALMSQTWWLERAIFPYAVVLQVVPILAITPLLGLWFGYSTMSRVAVCVMIALFPIITNTHFGFRSVDPGLHELFTLGRASRVQRLVRLELPAALPSILTGLRIASGQVIIGAIIGDMFFAQGKPGIGTLMDTFRAQLRSTDLIAAITLAAALGVVVFVACSAVSRLAVGRWHTSGGAR